MNNYFKSAIERYNKLLDRKQKEKGGYLVNPISEADAEIIIELKELLKKAGNEQALAILKEYKGGVADTEILDNLRQCNIDTSDHRLEEYEEEFGDEEKIEKKIKEREFIVLNDSRIEARLIFGYEPKDLSTFDEEKYQIRLNPCNVDATKLPLYANYKLTFYNEEEFEKATKLLDEQMKQANIKFVNKKTDIEDDSD